MKTFLLITTLSLCFCAKKSIAQNNSVYDSLKTLNLNHYASLPVDSFLRAIPQSYDYIKITGNVDNFKVRGLLIYYPNNLNIWIKPSQYMYMNPVDPNRIWNLTLFKKEKAHLIEVMDPELPPFLGYEQ